jgi:hypothetical protein
MFPEGWQLPAGYNLWIAKVPKKRTVREDLGFVHRVKFNMLKFHFDFGTAISV